MKRNKSIRPLRFSDYPLKTRGLAIQHMAYEFGVHVWDVSFDENSQDMLATCEALLQGLSLPKRQEPKFPPDVLPDETDARNRGPSRIHTWKYPQSQG